MIRLVIISLALVLVFGGCRNVTGSGGDSRLGRVLVEHEYSNHAWGYAHHGFYIDATGHVFGYDWRGSTTTWQANESGTYTEAELLAKYNHNVVDLGTIGADTLARIRSLILPSVGGVRSTLVTAGADMGQTDRIAYVYDPVTAKYTYVFLATTGDVDQRNTAPSAIQLADMLDSIAAQRR